jgi:deoxyribodipyrimidine photo-lyase
MSIVWKDKYHLTKCSMQKEISIVWFRQDLRISDNQSIVAASERGEILPVYIFDDCAPNGLKVGSASKIWLHGSLSKLNEALQGTLNLYIGQADQIIALLIKRYNVKNIFWNICYEPWHLDQEQAVKEVCNQTSTRFEAFNSNYLYSPKQVLKEDGGCYKVFTAYKNKAHSMCTRMVAPNAIPQTFVKDIANRATIEDLNLLPKNQWYHSIENQWDPGEEAAQHKLIFFIKNHLHGYKEDRNYPYKEGVSKLSPYLHFGEISPSQVLEVVNRVGHLYAEENDIAHFISEIMWREFSCYLLYHFPELPIKNFNSKFDNFPWENNLDFFHLWKKGKTGYPFIDAGMRELWQTGYMHNRVRMIVASFLVKNLNIHWRLGMDWFWDCLVDADLANNSASWQWVAASGVDAAPYFRIFNPTNQKFDSDGDYVKRFVPELKNMPNKYLFAPWMAPANVLKAAGVTLGVTYPLPIVDLVISRKNALARYKSLSRSSF